MKSLRFLFSAAILISILMISGCGGDPQPTSRIVGTWQVTNVEPEITVVGGGSLFDYLIFLGMESEEAEEYANDLTSGNAIEFDGVTIEFKKDGSYVSTDGPGTDNGTWEISSDEKTLVTDKGTSGEFSMTVTTLNETELVVSADLTEELDFPANTIKYLAILTFKRL